MPSTSQTGGFIERYETLTVAATVPIHFGYIPLKDSSGAAVNPPVALLEDLDTVPDYDLEYNPIENTTLRLTVYAIQLSDADSYAHQVRFNGGAVGAGSGMDFGSLASNLTGLTPEKLHLTRIRRGKTTVPALGTQPVHFVELNYTLIATRTA